MTTRPDLDAVAALTNHATPTLFTDLYELTMLEAYWREGLQDQATFSLFFRRLPARRNFALACGVHDVLDFLESVHFSAADIEYLATLNTFSSAFLEYLRSFRFTGHVRAMPEGTPVFPHEPLVEVDAPLPQAQLIETFVINQVHMQTVLASKAARVVLAARGRRVVDFGVRRMHGTDAGVKSARAFHIAGVDATSNVLAGYVHGVPLAGTMAHSFVQVYERELDAFRAFVRSFPKTTLLVDTYDTLDGIDNVITLARELGHRFRVCGVRLDSGDLLALSRSARAKLDAAGLRSVEIFASGGLDEDEIARLVAADAPIDGFGVGTAMGVSEDAPTLDMAYKLVEYAGSPRMKTSTGKLTLPGRKQVFREIDPGGVERDVIALADERGTRPLLVTMMENGRKLMLPTLEESRAYASEQMDALPPRILALAAAAQPFEVAISESLGKLRDSVAAATRERNHRSAEGTTPARAKDDDVERAVEGDADVDACIAQDEEGPTPTTDLGDAMPVRWSGQ